MFTTLLIEGMQQAAGGTRKVKSLFFIRVRQTVSGCRQQSDYKIIIADNLAIAVIKAAPLIIELYAENDIWKGLMHRDVALGELK